jgi:uncharacterized membrane protein YphA (DoxX/SURF4 family)
MQQFIQQAPEILLLFFLVITFLQSGIDKIFDWQGNLSWLKQHFADTFLKNLVPTLLGILLMLEILSGILCAIGTSQLLLTGEKGLAFAGAILSCITLLMLLFGQRMAKDYDGAKTIAVYFIPAIFLVYLLQLP